MTKDSVSVGAEYKIISLSDMNVEQSEIQNEPIANDEHLNNAKQLINDDYFSTEDLSIRDEQSDKDESDSDEPPSVQQPRKSTRNKKAT